MYLLHCPQIDGPYLLHLAVQGGSMDKVQILLQNWADTNAVREVSYTLMCVHVHVCAV